jgi:hypothetical protein
MARFADKYTDEQRDAVAEAYEDRGIRPASKVVALAKAGELTYNGRQLDPFEMPVLYVNELARNLRRKRQGKAKSGLADTDPRDAVEALRRRLVSAADNMLQDVERRQRRGKHDPKDPELLRQIARAAREIAAMPGKDDPRPVAPGQKIPGTGANNGDRTQGGLAGSILHAHRGPRVHADSQDPRQSTTQDARMAENATQRSHAHTETAQDRADARPGEWVRAQVGL